MAIYQFTIELIPESWSIEHYYNPSVLYKNQLYDLSTVWQGINLSSNLNNILSEVLPRGDAWHSNLKIWGDAEHNDIQLWMDNSKEKIEAITVRLDLISDFENMLKKIVILAKRLNCTIFLPEFRKIVPPNYILLKQIIQNSRAFKFIKDSTEYLNKIDLEKEGDNF